MARNSKKGIVTPESDILPNTQATDTAEAKDTKGFASFTGKDGNTYEVVLPKLSYKKRIYTAQEIADDETLREEMVAMAWKDRDGKRDEVEFDKNGVFRIRY